LQGVFKGISEGIKLFPEQFKEWKSFMRSLNSIDFTSLTNFELAKLASQAVPPQLQTDDGEVNGKEREEGSWYSGDELSIVQTMLLAAVLVPESSRSVVELMLGLTENYLSLGGIVVRHQDELSSDEDEDDEDGDYDDGDLPLMKPGNGRMSIFVNNHGAINEGNAEDDDDGGDNDENTQEAAVSIRPALLGSPKRNESEVAILNPSQMARLNIKYDDDQDDEDDEIEDDEGEERLGDDATVGDDTRSWGSFTESRTSVSSATSFGARGSTLSQYQPVKSSGLTMLNCWGYLKRVANGSAAPSYARYAKEFSRSTNNCRLFENWEVVLREVLGETIIETGNIPRSRAVSEDRIGTRSRSSSEEFSYSYAIMDVNLTYKLSEPKGPVHFKDMLTTDKYRLFMGQRSSRVPFKPYTPIFLGRANQDYQMSFLSHISRELTLHKEYNLPSGPRLVVINGSLLGKTDRVSYAMVSANKPVDRLTSGLQNWHNASHQGSVMDSISELCSVINEGVRSTAYLKTAGVKARGGTVYVLEMLNLHDPAFNKMFSQSIASDDAANAATEGINDQIQVQVRRPSAMEGALSSLPRPRRASRFIVRDPTSEQPPAGGRLSPVPMSVIWDHSPTSYGPVRALANFAFHWLPSVTVPEIISAGDLNTVSGVGVGLHIVNAPSAVIEGAIWEEVEMNYLTTSNAIKRLVKISRDVFFKDKLRTLSSFDIRVASGVVSIWRFLLYIRSRSLEVEGKPGAWSVCLAPLSSSQIAHLTMRVAEVLKDAWQTIISMMKMRAEQGNDRNIIRAARIELTAQELLMNSYFSRCVWLCIENLCHISHAAPGTVAPGSEPSNNKSPDRGTRSSLIGRAVARANDSIVSPSSPSQAKTATPGAQKARSVSPSRAPTTNAGSNAAGPLSPSGPATGSASAPSPVGNPGRVSPSPLSPHAPKPQPVPPTVEKPSNIAKRTSFNTANKASAAVALNSSKPTPKRGLRAAKAKVNYLSFKEITDPALLVKFVYRDSFAGEEFKNRLLATVGRYLAEVIANRHSRPSSVDQVKKATGASPVVVSRNSPMDRVNQLDRDAPATPWPDLSALPCDLSMGPIESERLIEFLTEWSLSS
jgi:hypothetical protein